jgi:hypothetical protein
MEPIILTDPNVQPTDELVFSIIGENSAYWVQLVDYLYENHFDITEEWRFYNDGKVGYTVLSGKRKPFTGSV